MGMMKLTSRGKWRTTGFVDRSGGGGPRGPEHLDRWSPHRRHWGRPQEEQTSRHTLALSISCWAQGWSTDIWVRRGAREARRQTRGLAALEGPGGGCRLGVRRAGQGARKSRSERRGGLLQEEDHPRPSPEGETREGGSRGRRGAIAHQRPLPLSQPSLHASLRSGFELCGPARLPREARRRAGGTGSAHRLLRPGARGRGSRGLPAETAAPATSPSCLEGAAPSELGPGFTPAAVWPRDPPPQPAPQSSGRFPARRRRPSPRSGRLRPPSSPLTGLGL